MVKVLPLPYSDSTWMVPLWCLIISQITNRPKPVPLVEVALVVKKGTKSLSNCSLVIPIPLSWILIIAQGTSL